MEIAQLVLEYIKTLWPPLIILVVYFSLRQEIKWLMTGKLSATYKDWSITLEHQEKIIESMQETQREVAQVIREELKSIPEKERWSGFDWKANRISTALYSLELGSLEYLIVSHLRHHNRCSSVSKLVDELIAPGPRMEAYEFNSKKSQLASAIDNLKAKGIVSASDKGELELHPWAEHTFTQRDPTTTSTRTGFSADAPKPAG